MINYIIVYKAAICLAGITVEKNKIEKCGIWLWIKSGDVYN
jgi:hypothetical protein